MNKNSTKALISNPKTKRVLKVAFGTLFMVGLAAAFIKVAK